MTGRRANETTGPRDDRTARLRDHETTGPRDCEATRPLKNTGVLSHSQPCVAVRGCARLCEVVRGSLASEWCRCGAKSKFGWMGVYLAYIPIQTNELGAADVPLSRQELGGRRVADVFYRKRECRGIVLKRTAHGTLLFGMGRRCALMPPSGYCKNYFTPSRFIEGLPGTTSLGSTNLGVTLAASVDM